MSNILYRELRSTYRWLRTFLQSRSYRARAQYRGQMRRNRVWAFFFTWLLERGRDVD